MTLSWGYMLFISLYYILHVVVNIRYILELRGGFLLPHYSGLRVFLDVKIVNEKRLYFVRYLSGFDEVYTISKLCSSAFK